MFDVDKVLEYVVFYTCLTCWKYATRWYDLLEFVGIEKGVVIDLCSDWIQRLARRGGGSVFLFSGGWDTHACKSLMDRWQWVSVRYCHAYIGEHFILRKVKDEVVLSFVVSLAVVYRSIWAQGSGFFYHSRCCSGYNVRPHWSRYKSTTRYAQTYVDNNSAFKNVFAKLTQSKIKYLEEVHHTKLGHLTLHTLLNLCIAHHLHDNYAPCVSISIYSCKTVVTHNY